MPGAHEIAAMIKYVLIAVALMFAGFGLGWADQSIHAAPWIHSLISGAKVVVMLTGNLSMAYSLFTLMFHGDLWGWGKERDREQAPVPSQEAPPAPEKKDGPLKDLHIDF